MHPQINSPSEDKAAARRTALDARAAMGGPARAAASAAICARLRALPELAEARTVIGYAAFGTEADVDEVLAEIADSGRGLLLPYVEDDEIGIARVHDLTADLAPGYRGVREPKAIGRRRANPQRCEAAIVPGAAFDRRGGRVGYGGGHFDRLLAQLADSAPVIAAAFAAQVLDRVPREAHDIPIDILVTEEEVLRVPR